MSEVQPRLRVQSPRQGKPHIWRQQYKEVFIQNGAWMCANLAFSVVKFGARGNTPAEAFSAWAQLNSGTGRHG